MPIYNTGYNAYANGYPQYGVAGNYVIQPTPQPNPQQYVQNMNYQQPPVHYVHGIAGANAFQLPNGVDKVTLWDEDDNCFYVKGYDNNGIPRILAWNDYFPHKEPQVEEKQVDMSIYATKDDIKSMLASLDFSSFLTKKEFDEWRTGKDREDK